MSEDPKFCDRCGGQIGRGAAHITVATTDETVTIPIPPRDVCRICVNSYSRWLERGQTRSQNQSRRRSRSRSSDEQQPTSRRSRGRVRREQIAYILVIILCLMFCAYLYNNYE